jgi:hypothetical protein
MAIRDNALYKLYLVLSLDDVDSYETDTPLRVYP